MDFFSVLTSSFFASALASVRGHLPPAAHDLGLEAVFLDDLLVLVDGLPADEVRALVQVFDLHFVYDVAKREGDHLLFFVLTAVLAVVMVMVLVVLVCSVTLRHLSVVDVDLECKEAQKLQ